MNSSESQIFVLNSLLELTSEYKNTVFYEAQKAMVCRALNDAAQININYPIVVIPGVSHYGHFIGDQVERIVWIYKSGLIGDRTLITVNLPVKNAELLDFLGIPPQTRLNISTSNPIIIDAQNASYPGEIVNKTGKIHLEMTSILIRNKLIKSAYPDSIKWRKVFLSSYSYTRLDDRDAFVKIAINHGWLVLDPLKVSLEILLAYLFFSDEVISENGSILLNCFLACHRPYFVLASPRIASIANPIYQSSEKYNNYHKELISYIPCPMVSASSKHPYSDLIKGVNELCLQVLQSKSGISNARQNKVGIL